MGKCALLIVSHSATLARGVIEVAEQMAPDVTLRAAAGRDDGGIGTSYDLVEGAVSELVAAGQEVVILTDLGSATMTVDSVLEFHDDEPVTYAPGPLVEGAIAGAVAAAGGAGRAEVAAAIAQASAQLAGDAAGKDGSASDAQSRGTAAGEETCEGGATSSAGATSSEGNGAVSETVSVGHAEGLHARPAAEVARLAATFDAEVTINGADATSVMALMTVGARAGDQVTISASGAQAREALEAVSAKVRGD